MSVAFFLLIRMLSELILIYFLGLTFEHKRDFYTNRVCSVESATNKKTFHHVKSLSVFIIQITLVQGNKADIGTHFSFVNA